MLHFNLKKFLPFKQSKTSIENRKYYRFSIMKDLQLKVHMRILPYYRSKEIDGILENFSAGGMALKLPIIIPEKTYIYMQVFMPQGLCISCHCEVKHVKKINSTEYQHGIEFLDLPKELKDLILFMSREYLDCKGRTKHFRKTNCTPQCAAYGICSRHEKIYIKSPTH